MADSVDPRAELRSKILGDMWVTEPAALRMLDHAVEVAGEEIERLRADNRALRENLSVESDGWKDITSALSAQETDAKHEAMRLQGALLVADMLIKRLYEPLTTGETGHPGEPSRRTRWIPQRRVDELWQTIVAWRESWSASHAGESGPRLETDEQAGAARYALDQLGRCIDAVDHIVMDTEEDRARHARLVETFRHPLATIPEAPEETDDV